ncbi:MAG: hypothetical protein IIA83_06155 [Thaumarchaeota archaeon]|nr:hypothetical protein [Nitrososphaerota archaeon]
MPTRIKEISGNKYLYYVYYEDGKKKDVYCGLASSPESKRKALELKLEHLREQKKSLTQHIIEVENKLKNHK